MGVSRVDDAEAVRRFVAVRDVPCPGCGYNLRGLTRPVCPECGLRLSVDGIRRSLRQRGGAPVVLAGIGVLMFAVLALPTAAFVMLMAAGMSLGAAAGVRAERVLILVGLGATGLLLFASPLLVARWWDRGEARVAGMGRAARWGIAGLCWSWVAVLAVLMVVMQG